MEQVNKSAGDGNASDSASQTGQQGFPLSREGGLSFFCPSDRVPAELVERFLPLEMPTFEVMRTSGRVRLWRSSTRDCNLHGCPMSGCVRYHVTTDDEADYVLMPRLDAALASFDFAVQQAKEGAAHG